MSGDIVIGGGGSVAVATSELFDDARQLRRLWKQAFGVSIAKFRAARSSAAEGKLQ